jgi:hypothetical protein
MCDLTVAVDHDFYVTTGDQAADPMILVHNKCVNLPSCKSLILTWTTFAPVTCPAVRESSHRPRRSGLRSPLASVSDGDAPGG